MYIRISAKACPGTCTPNSMDESAHVSAFAVTMLLVKIKELYGVTVEEREALERVFEDCLDDRHRNAIKIMIKGP